MSKIAMSALTASPTATASKAGPADTDKSFDLSLVTKDVGSLVTKATTRQPASGPANGGTAQSLLNAMDNLGSEVFDEPAGETAHGGNAQSLINAVNNIAPGGMGQAGPTSDAQAEKLFSEGMRWADTADEHQAKAAETRSAIPWGREQGIPEDILEDALDSADGEEWVASLYESKALQSAQALENLAAKEEMRAKQLDANASKLLDTSPGASLQAKALSAGADQARANAAEYQQMAERIRLNVADSEPIRVATYNTYNKDTADEIKSLAETHDIFGLQEIDNGAERDQVSSALGDTHGEYFGEAAEEHKGPRQKLDGLMKPKTSSFAPIFYNKERFDPIDSESVRLHGENFDDKGGSDRYANFLLLKDKTNGSTVLVVNTHWSNTSDEAKDVSRDVINNKIAEFKKEHSVDGVVVLGDFNTTSPDLAGMTGETPAASVDADGHTGIDHVLVDKGVIQYNTKTIDGGESDHDAISSEILIRDPGILMKAAMEDAMEGVKDMLPRAAGK